MRLSLAILTAIFTCLIPLSVSADKGPLSFEKMFTMNRIGSHSVSPDGKWIAYQMTKYDLETNKGNSDIYLVSADGKVTRRLTTFPGGDASPAWSGDSKQVYFVSARDGSSQIYSIAIDGGEAQQVTAVPSGVNSFILSPNGKNFAISSSIYPDAASPSESAALGKQRAANKASGRIIDGLLYRHWNSWQEDLYSHLIVMPAAGGEAIDLTPGPRHVPPISLGSGHDIVWSTDSRHIVFVENADPMIAKSTNNDLWRIAVDGGEATKLTANRANDNGPKYSPNGKHIAYMAMAREGFEADQQDLILMESDASARKNLTSTLDRSVSDFVWAPDGRKIYFKVPHHGRHRLYEVDIRSEKLQLLLENRYISSLSMHPDGKTLILLSQATHQPNELFRFDIRRKRMTQLTSVNKATLAKLNMNPIEDYWFSGAKGDSVHMLMIKPPQFDPAKQYPMIALIHGGPQGAWGDNFHYRWNSQLFSAPGYVVTMINFHGSRGYGQEFCDAVTQNWGGAPYEDIMIGTRWAAESFDFIDKDRIGAAGASYGGFMINWIEGHNPDSLFKTLVSHAGLYEQVSFFGATEELWFPMWEFNGAPWQPGSLYQKWNPANHVENFHTPMLVIHGEHDYRVPYGQALQLFTALQLKGVESRLLFYPDEDHFVRKPANAQLWWETVHQWLGRYLAPAPLP